MKNPEFNLLDEPWIPVRLLDGTIAEVGLLDLLRRLPIVHYQNRYCRTPFHQHQYIVLVQTQSKYQHVATLPAKM